MKKQSPINQETLDSFCFPVAKAVMRYQKEEITYARIHRLIAVFEVLVKYVVSFTLLYGKNHLQDEGIKDFQCIFQESIYRPSLGHWVGYLRALLCPSKKEIYWAFLEEKPFACLNESFGAVQESLNDFVALRNRYGHGTVAEDRICLVDCKKFEPRLWDILGFFSDLLTLPFYTSDGEEGFQWRGTECLACALPVESKDLLSPFVVCNEEAFSLFPLMYVPDHPAHLFYNSLRNYEKQYFRFLNYETGAHVDDQDQVGRHFFDLFPKVEMGLTNPTTAKRLGYLENFVGRHQELRTLLEFLVKEDKGYFMTWGAPGVGKGALISQVEEVVVSPQDYSFLEKAFQEKLKEFQCGVLVTYLLHEKDDDPVKLLQNLVRPLAKKLQYKKAISSDRGKLESLLEELLYEASQRKFPVVMIIDGLDEVLRLGSSMGAIISAIPSCLPYGCFVLFTSRSVPAVRRFWRGLNREHRSEMTLPGISFVDVREMLCSELNKYEVFDHKEFVERLYGASVGGGSVQGNPHFVKLVLNELHQGRLSLDKPLAIPRNLEEMYEGFLERLSDGGRELLYLVAAALGPLSRRQMARILDRNIDKVAPDLAIVQEMFEEGEEKVGTKTYSLFHKSLGDFLVKRDRNKLETSSDKLLIFCRNWQDYIAEWEKCIKKGYSEASDWWHAASYALRHLCDHLLKAIEQSDDETKEKLLQKLVDTIDQKEFREKVFKYCGNLSPLQRGIIGAQKLLSSQDSQGRNLSVMVRFALYMTDDKQRMLSQAASRLEDAAKEGAWLEVLNLMEMRETDREKVFAALQALCLLPKSQLARAIGPIEARVKPLLRFEADPQLDACYQEVVDMLLRNGCSQAQRNPDC